jgi:diphthamide synthase subunit DPH2
MMVLLYNFQLPEDLILFSVKYASILERKVEKNWAFLPSQLSLSDRCHEKG